MSLILKTAIPFALALLAFTLTSCGPTNSVRNNLSNFGQSSSQKLNSIGKNGSQKISSIGRNSSEKLTALGKNSSQKINTLGKKSSSGFKRFKDALSFKKKEPTPQLPEPRKFTRTYIKKEAEKPKKKWKPKKTKAIVKNDIPPPVPGVFSDPIPAPTIGLLPPISDSPSPSRAPAPDIPNLGALGGLDELEELDTIPDIPGIPSIPDLAPTIPSVVPPAVPPVISE